MDISGKAPTGVTLTLWHTTSDSPSLLKLYQAYEAESGNKIELTDIPGAQYPFTVQAKWATGARPDILEWSGNSMDELSLNVEKNMLDLTKLPFVEKEGDLAKISGSLDGKTYGATLGPLSVRGIYYNKQVLAKAGLQAPKNYADLASDCQVLKSSAPSVTPIFEAGGSGWPPANLAAFAYMGQYNVNNAYSDAIVAGTQKVTDPDGPFLKALNAYDALRTSGCFNKDATTATWENSLKAVLNGSAAMVASTTDSVALLDADAGGDKAKVDAAVGFVGVSATEPIANVAASVTGTYYLPKTGDQKKQRAAADFIQFVTGKGYQQYIDDAGAIPTLSGATTPDIQGLMRDVKEASVGAGLTVNASIPGFGNFGPDTDKILAGQLTPEAAAQQMQTFFEQAQAATKK